MRKETLERLVETFACLDPVGYGHYLMAKEEARRLQATAEVDKHESELRCLIERLEARSEATA